MLNLKSLGTSEVCDLVQRSDALNQLKRVSGSGGGAGEGEDDEGGGFPNKTHMIAGGLGRNLFAARPHCPAGPLRADAGRQGRKHPDG